MLQVEYFVTLFSAADGVANTWYDAAPVFVANALPVMAAFRLKMAAYTPEILVQVS